MITKVSWFNKEKGFGLAEDEQGVRYFLHYTKMDDETLKAVNEDAFEGKFIQFKAEPGATPIGIAASNIRFA